MEKIGEASWKLFNLADIFRMRNTRSVIQKNIVPDSGNVAYVTAQAGNNGVLTYVDCPDEWLEEGNCIMIGGKTLTFSYQAKPFCSNDSHNIALYLKDKTIASERRYLFLIAVLRCALTEKYCWGDSISLKRINQDKLPLPVDAKGDPDWEYMDGYMSDIMKETEISLEQLSQTNGVKHELDVTNWKRFHLYDNDLFEIDTGTKLDRVKMTQVKPEVNFIGRANSNNGITAQVDRIRGLEPYASGNMTLSLGGEYLGSCFVQPKPFYTSQNVVVLIPKKKMSFAVKQFIATMIFRESRSYYKAFIDELNRHLKTDFSFYLPIDGRNKPDWKFMEEFMCKEIKAAEDTLSVLANL